MTQDDVTQEQDAIRSPISSRVHHGHPTSPQPRRPNKCLQNSVMLLVESRRPLIHGGKGGAEFADTQGGAEFEVGDTQGGAKVGDTQGGAEFADSQRSAEFVDTQGGAKFADTQKKRRSPRHARRHRRRKLSFADLDNAMRICWD